MNYQVQASKNQNLIQRSNFHINPVQSQDTSILRRQRSNSGKKFTLIRKKSNSNNINSQQKQHININKNSQSQIQYSNYHHNKPTIYQSSHQNDSSNNQSQNNALQQNRPKNTNLTDLAPINLSSAQINKYPTNSSSNAYISQQEERLNKNSQNIILNNNNDMQISRGQFYQNQLNDIQKDIQFFRLELEQTHNKNRQLQMILSDKQQEYSNFIKFIHSQINNISGWPQAKQLSYPSLKQVIHQTSSSPTSISSQANNLQNQLILLVKYLNMVLKNQNNFQQIIQSQQITLKQFQAKINELVKQNIKIKNDNKKLKQVNQMNMNVQAMSVAMQDLEDSKKKITKNLDPEKNAMSIKINNNKALISRQQQTAQNSRQQNQSVMVNSQVQTEQKRIGSAASIQKYNSYRFTQGGSPYKNYIVNSNYRKGSVLSKQSKDSNTNNEPSTRNSPYQQNTRFKVNFQSIKQKRTNLKQKTTVNTNTNKKGNTPKTAYLNHLIQSQTLIKAQNDSLNSLNNKMNSQKFNTFNNSGSSKILLTDSKNLNTKSQLYLRRPIHRSRSHSQQQVPSSRERSISNKSNNINNIASRVSSAYSLNPVNKYGQKRLCNQVNSKKIRKITQLSQQSQQLEQRIKMLMEEEQMLKQKFKQVQKIKVSRQKSKKNSRENSRKNSRVVY